jgi:hypothetical protein
MARLWHRLVLVMPAPLPGARISRDRRGGKDPLPTPFAVRVGIFARQRVRKRDAPETCRQIGLVERTNPFEISAEPRNGCRCQHGDPILVALAFAHQHLAPTEVHVFDA